MEELKLHNLLYSGESYYTYYRAINFKSFYFISIIWLYTCIPIYIYVMCVLVLIYMNAREKWMTNRLFSKPQLMVVKQVTEQPSVFLACFWINYLGAWPSRVSWKRLSEDLADWWPCCHSSVPCVTMTSCLLVSRRNYLIARHAILSISSISLSAGWNFSHATWLCVVVVVLLLVVVWNLHRDWR